MCGDVTAAERHYVEAARRNEKIGAPTFVARSWFDHARLCAETGDSAEARRLVHGVLDIARQIGMPTLELQADALARKLGPGPHR